MLKHFPFRNFLPAMVILAFAMTMAGCSTQKNTAKSRWWHAFNARYNTYYNGTVAYIEGSLEKENGNKDNYSEMIPYYTVGNKNSRELGKSNYDRAIEKCEKAIHQHSIKRRPVWDKKRRKTAKDLEWLQRREYNPFLWKAWMLMGRSQFFEGDFQSAAATFAYMSRLYATQPGIYGKARAWLAKSYLESGWIYDAEDVIRNIERDSIHWRAQKEWDKTYALYYLKTGRYQEAVPYLRKAIGYEMRRKQKARLWYLMGQVEALQGHTQNAYRAFKHVIRLNPPYELEFNARISMTEVLATNNSRKMVSKLKRMAASDKNQEYLDQVYYAIGNIHLNQGDTLQAIAAYEKGAAKSSRNGVEKGVLLLHLGNVYWQCHRYGDAKRCYDAAIGLLDQDRKDYKQLSDRSKVLDELVPYTDAIHLQDSLQSLARMSETERNVAIDKVIDALKKQEKEEKRRLADQELAEQQGNSDFGRNNGNGYNSRNNRNQGNSNASSGFGNGAMGNGDFGNTNTWYFYSQSAVAQGKQQFERLWGKRKNIDNWQRSNQTVVADAKGVEEMTDEQRDSLLNEAQKKDLEKEKEKNLSAEEDPHQRAYYLAQIPLTEEKMAESNQILDDGLLHAGIILKDKLNDLDEIEHDPYVLLSLLCALHEGQWTIGEVQGTLQMLFDRQYILTEDVVVETRYRTETDTWTDEDGNSHTDTYQVPYDYYICTVTLENFDLSHVPVYVMGEDQLSRYAIYMATLGNRPDLFPDSPYVNKYITGKPGDYEVPGEYLDDETFAAMLAEAQKYIGYPYVWGGSSPATSFDCSGYVSWVINHSGWNVGRLGAQGLYNICTPTSSPKPGDLVFFKGTYDTPGVSHCGIYVGDGKMLHCGDPIGYANLNTSYWQSHFYAYGRLP